MTKSNVTRLPAVPNVPGDLIIEIERKVSRALSELSVVQMVLGAKKREGASLDAGAIACLWDVLDRAQTDMINIEWPSGLDYYGNLYSARCPECGQAKKAEGA